MLQKATLRQLTILSLIIVTPLGFLSKYYKGPGDWWFNDYGGGVLYEIFWCLFVFLLIPNRPALVKIPIWVFIVTCILEILQLWHPPFLQAIRAQLWGKLLLGTTFVWWDFPHYAIGSLVGWLWLRQLWRLHVAKKRQNEKTS
ncbi:DUF2809 domain-containing protein [Planktothrix sp. FACHB-1355]|uniref:DUF2809 domain-containing protein n=1 Tax=Aerosakkonema funiforme FACHB-1375 TaxID=2949571 RepID=A0A926ZGV6_9CYAN|nr:MULTISPECIES: DUF2809 domain-containing protein [Oscillatoriales]MBD2182633.1 DUF2809 domain-containing protein [Aerosakkonema funiforme FACHB-1375]MBD3561033.1 DUF2809 domain-containing protein [Planktothrix sp. FACHB-1355]